MKKTPPNPSTSLAPALVQELDDAALRGGHALLAANRVQEFACWLELQLSQLEERLGSFDASQFRRRAWGR